MPPPGLHAQAAGQVMRSLLFVPADGGNKLDKAMASADGAASVIHLDAKLTAREAVADIPAGHIKILAQAVETAAGVFSAGDYRKASQRLIGLTWGPEDLSAELGAEANRDTDGRLTEP